MNFAVAPALAAYKQTLDLARENKDNDVLETFGNDGITERTLHPDSIVIDSKSNSLHISQSDGTIVEIPLSGISVFPAITFSRIRQHIEAAKNAVGKLSGMSAYLFLIYEGEQSNIRADQIRIDSYGFWLPNGGGFEWPELSSISYIPKNMTGKNPSLTISIAGDDKIILKV